MKKKFRGYEVIPETSLDTPVTSRTAGRTQLNVLVVVLLASVTFASLYRYNAATEGLEPDRIKEPIYLDLQVSSSIETSYDAGTDLVESLRDSLSNISLLPDRVLFGHQMTSYSGQYFLDKFADGNHSDVQNATGEFPVVYGFDFTKVVKGYGDIAKHVEKAYARGGVISFMWNTPNPVNGGDNYNKSGNPVKELLPGGSANKVWTAYLDTLADFCDSLNGVPIVFRLFHEMTGWWFWWGTATCTSEQFVAAFQYTVNYLRKTRGVDNILIFYATHRAQSQNRSKLTTLDNDMRALYPGDEYVDIIGFDCYDNITWYGSSLNESCNVVFPFAEERNKIAVIGETGHTDGGFCEHCSEMWESFLTVFKDTQYSQCHKAAYAITWENYNTDHWWIPLVGQNAYEGFTKFYEDPVTAFELDSGWRDIASQSGYINGRIANSLELADDAISDKDDDTVSTGGRSSHRSSHRSRKGKSSRKGGKSRSRSHKRRSTD